MFSIYLKQREVNENTCQKNTHLTETINKNVVDEWRKGLLWNVHDCIMASMTGSLIESGLTKEKEKNESAVSDWTKHVSFYDFSFKGFLSNRAIWLPFYSKCSLWLAAILCWIVDSNWLDILLWTTGTDWWGGLIPGLDWFTAGHE